MQLFDCDCIEHYDMYSSNGHVLRAPWTQYPYERSDAVCLIAGMRADRGAVEEGWAKKSCVHCFKLWRREEEDLQCISVYRMRKIGCINSDGRGNKQRGDEIHADYVSLRIHGQR